MRAKLADLQGKREEHQRQDKERAFAVKYRKVKFFETRKIIRKLRTIQRQIKEVRGVINWGPLLAGRDEIDVRRLGGMG